ncbi:MULTISPECIES: hypothetical protein [unclassified Kitasatospora]|uniref:DUF7848 domain-containing protein n=1 Tax=unclassified Kitasatospora TaxID=2633591 RepID=UPI00340CD799
MVLEVPAREIGKRRLFRFLLWKFGPDPDRDEVHLVYCEGEAEDGTPCGADSGEHIERETAELWAFEHAADEPEHRSYGHLAYRPMITTPTEEPT